MPSIPEGTAVLLALLVAFIITGCLACFLEAFWPD